jgi:hypothetical protein
LLPGRPVRGKKEAVPRWIERRGHTLRLSPSDDAAAPSSGGTRDGLVRLSVVERMGLVRGWFNVREARAEPSADGERLRPLSDGRALSWRWLREAEADRLLEARLGTLQAMGYALVDSGVAMRGRWDWLYDLVHKRLAQAEPPEAVTRSGSALEDALTRIGLSPDAIVEGLAAVLGLSPHGLRHPEPRVIHRTDPAELSILLPFLVHHDDAEIRAIGQRWMGCPSAVYQLPLHVLQHWLETDRNVAGLVGPRLRAEGLALLGPDALVRLHRTGCTPEIREAARTWVQRLG